MELPAPRRATARPYVSTGAGGRPGPVVAVSDCMRAVQTRSASGCRGDFTSLGTDGFGLSDTRGALRRHFKIDAESITLRTLEILARRGEVDADLPRQAFERYGIDDVTSADPGTGMGDA